MKLVTVVVALLIAAAVGYLHFRHGPEAVIGLEAGALGDFLAGVLAAPALILLVLGYRQQCEELKANTTALKDAVQQAEQQSRALSRASFLQQVEVTYKELNGHLSTVVRTTGGDEDAIKLWELYSHGDVFAFTRWCKEYILDRGQNAIDTKNDDDPAHVAVRRYCAIFEKLLAEARRSDDESQTLLNSHEWSPHGEVYALFTRVRGFPDKLSLVKHSGLMRQFPNKGKAA